MNIKNKDVGILVNKQYHPSLEAGKYISKILRSIGVNNYFLGIDDVFYKEVKCDLVFNVYYGELGDGGFISGILKNRGIKFIGNNQYSCSLMWNKIISKMLFIKEGFHTPKYWYSFNNFKKEDEINRDVLKKLSLPIIVKPVNGAASEGIVLIKDRETLKKFIKSHIEYINVGYYFFEEFIKGIEISSGRVQLINRKLPIAEIVIKDNDFQDNSVKFKSGLKENIVPARLPKDIYKYVQNTVFKLHSIFKATCFSRVDMIYDVERDKIYILEINTNPGLLATSLLPLIVKEAGVSEKDFFRLLIESAVI